MSRFTRRVASDLGEIADRATVTPDAIESIRQRISVDGQSSRGPRSDGVGRDTPSTHRLDDSLPVDLDGERARRGGSRRPLVWAGVVAAVLVLVVGIVVVAREDQQDGLETFDVPDEDARGPATTTTSTTTTASPVDPWAFDITYIEVDAGNPVAASEDFAWVVGTAESVLSTIDLATNEIVATTEIPPGGGKANFGFGSVWISHTDGTVSRFDPITRTMVATIDVGGDLGWIEPGIDSVWLRDRTGEVVRIDPVSNSVIARIDVGGTPSAVGENEHGVWFTDGVDEVIRVDPATNAVVARVEVDAASGFMVGPDAAWVPGSVTGLVYRIDPATNAVSAEIDIGGVVGEPVIPAGAHFAGGTVWVRYAYDCVEENCTQQGVARIDPETNEVVATADLREGWRQSGPSAGPTTAWTFDDTAIARFDFDVEASAS